MKCRVPVPRVLILGLLAGVVACDSSREEANPETDVAPAPQDAQAVQGGLDATSWRLVKFEGGDETVLTPDDPSKYTLAFQPGGRLSARIDCNRGMGTWRSSGPPQLEFGPLALTRAMCPPGSLHDHIVKQWPYIRSYVMRDGHLFVSLMADGGIYEFEPLAGASTGATEALENTYWKLTHLAGSPVPGDFERAEPHLIFNSLTGRVTGSGGCNRLSGGYEVSGDKLDLTRMVGTMMACEEGMETEQAFLQALGRVGRWSITGRQLELLDADGKVVAQLEGLHMK